MDAVSSFRKCLSTWSRGGALDCRNILLSPHCNPCDPTSVDVLTTAYHTLIASTLKTWSTTYTLTPDELISFIQSVLDGLPSSSTSRTSPSNAFFFGEILIDVLWAIDAELEEIIGEAKASAANCNDQNAVLEMVIGVKQIAESDKDVITTIVKKLLNSNIINAAHCRERLDLALLASVGLISDKASFDKKEIRTRTGLFYKQNKFNLLREQSEGYSKLTAELTSSLGPAHSPFTGRPIESSISIEKRAHLVWDKVICLIGYFDLDPNRALDIILDVMSVHLTTHYHFFLALLSFSPWAELHRRPQLDIDHQEPDPQPGKYEGKSLDDILISAEASSISESSSSSMQSSSNPRVLAQVLGFKFAYYQSTDVAEETPRSLYLTAAILIREGLLTLEDLYPHLSPSDDDMKQIQQEYLAKVQSRISSAKVSQLAMAAPLESGSSSSKTRTTVAVEPKVTEAKELPNQKVGLLSAMLSIGALRPAFAIMSKFPWLVDAHLEVADLVLRILKQSLSRLYDSLLVTKERNSSFGQPRARYGAGGVSLPSPRKPHLTTWAPTPPSTSSTEFVFFFPDWTRRVPVCSSLSDLVDVIEPMMHFIGLHVSRDPLFLTKFLRLGRLHIISTIPIDPETKKPIGDPDSTHPIRVFWYKILRLYLLPALPLIRGNAVCTVEVWNIIRQYETTARWSLYGEWRTMIYNSHPELRIRQVQADRESKGILRRLSHETIDSLSGTVAKLAHSNPCIFFTNAVNQIMAYDNLADVVIQALRFVTNMGFDVLVFVILDALANPHRERVKDDGVNTSDWLQSLASFTGMLFRRYSADLTPVLKYIVHQLFNGQTTEIVVLRELIWKMAGIEPLPSLSESQIAAMAGGPALRIEAVASTTRGARLDPGDAVLKGPQRLGKCLLESSLALPLLIQVAQQRQSCVFKAPDAHLKSLAGLYDTTHGVLLQYLELLTSPAVVLPKDYATKVLPSLAELGEIYGISAPICMQIIRPMLQGTLLTAALSMQEQERAANEEAEKRLKAALTAKREPVVASRVASPNVGASNTVTDLSTNHASDVTVGNSSSAPEHEEPAMEMDLNPIAVSSISPEKPWLPELFSLFDQIKRVTPGNAYEVIGPGFYVTFWQLSTYDLTPPSTKYDEEGAALRTLSRQEDAKCVAADRSSDRAKRLTASAHRARRDRYNVFVNTLAQEFKDQTISRAFTMKRLAREKQHWFSHAPKGNVLVSSIIEHCIQPRCLLSPMDADFCAQFIKIIHTQGTPGFPTLLCYDKLLGDHVKVVIFSCSEYEARNYGRFLLGILMDLWKWHEDESSFIQDNRTRAGGKTILHPGLQIRWTNKSNVVADDLLKWIGFKQILRKWHRKLAKCFTDCIQAGEFMHVYNAIIVLKEILPVFPLAAVCDIGASLDKTMQDFLEIEERGDLKILSRAYAASLKRREPLWAVPKAIKPSGNSAPSKSTNRAATPQSSDKSRISTAPSDVLSRQGTPTGDIHRNTNTNPSTSTPSAPRSQLNLVATVSQQTVTDKPSDGANSTKLAMESVPRPERVRRVRPDSKDSGIPKGGVDTKHCITANSEAINVEPLRGTQNRDGPGSANMHVSDNDVPDARGPALKDPPHSTDQARPQTTNPSHHLAMESLQSVRPVDNKATCGESQAVMPPPSVPSQILSTQELRETAKQTITRPIDKPEDKTIRLTAEPFNQNGSAVPSPASRQRSQSPPTRPGTRTTSPDSRPRSDGDRNDDRRAERDNRQDRVGRREGINHSRNVRDRTSMRESEKDKETKDMERNRDRDRGRDRHGDRERDKDREREKDRERDRDRDRDRDRHRRDDKDRDRDVRKERDASSRSTAVPTNPESDDRISSSRTEPSRHRSLQNGDESLGKRRRLTEDDPDRGSKRSSRKDGHREDRSRRATEREMHDRSRESDRRRKDRDGPEPDSRSLIPEKSGEKRFQDNPSTKNLPPTTPSAPRAMASSDFSRTSKVDTITRDRDWKSQRDATSQNPSSGSSTVQKDAGSQGLAPLRSRISDKESSRPPPQISSGSSYRPDTSRQDDDRDSSRKRSMSDRERDTANEPLPAHTAEQTTQLSSKRPRINRNRYNPSSYAIAKKSLPIDPQATDRSRVGRQD